MQAGRTVGGLHVAVVVVMLTCLGTSPRTKSTKGRMLEKCIVGSPGLDLAVLSHDLQTVVYLRQRRVQTNKFSGSYVSVKAICLRDQNTQVNSSFCNARTKPATEPQMCSAFSCPAYWKPGEWSACSRSCAGGQQSRKIQCVQKKPFQKEEAVLHSLCPVSTPTQVQVCNAHTCPPGWSLGPWSQCSKTCGRGMRKREVLCKSSATAEALPENLCSSTLRPESQEGCVLGRCPRNNRLQWAVSSWSECSVTCGLGTRKREVKCSEKASQGKLITFPERRCRNIKKPNLDMEETCNRGACPARPGYPTKTAAGWYPSPWQQCTVTCGGGVQTRTVHCLQQGRPSSSCLLRQKPPVLQACNTNFCPAPEKREDSTTPVLKTNMNV
ncbi:hypothetical protein MC885_020448 [Smutsia gigantea]|nr:hypothetical protein MC885_020448 [Smutsia gigantea]